MHYVAMPESVARDELIEFLRCVRQARKDGFTGGTPDKEALRRGRAGLDKFLFRLCFRETPDPEVASLIAELARREFYRKASTVEDDDIFESRVNLALWGGASVRFWLFKTVRALARDAVRNMVAARRQAAELGVAALWKGRPSPPPAPARAGDCELQANRFAALFRRQGFCGRGCDLMFFLDQEFSQAEIAEALRLKPSTAWRYLADCEGHQLAARGRGNSPSRPGGNPVATTEGRNP
jgi:hypothetical protein